MRGGFVKNFCAIGVDAFFWGRGPGGERLFGWEIEEHWGWRWKGKGLNENVNVNCERVANV